MGAIMAALGPAVLCVVVPLWFIVHPLASDGRVGSMVYRSLVPPSHPVSLVPCGA